MRTASFVVVGIILTAISVTAKEGKVTLPLSTWEEMQHEIQKNKEKQEPPIVVLPVKRNIEGTLRKGLFHGQLTSQFTVLDTKGHVRVQVLDAAASVGTVRLNGVKTSLLKEGGLYTVGIDKPGTYMLAVEMFWGKEQESFSRRLQFRLPEAGATRFSVLVPERDIEAKIEHGVLVSERSGPGGTQLVGQLDPTGQLDISWARKLTHKLKEKARMKARVFSLFTVQEALVSGLSAIDFEVQEGETDRVDLRLPADLEVLRVEGDAVLQWHTAEADGGQLTILFRHIVEDKTRVSIHYQFPADIEKTVILRMPSPLGETATSGALGVQGPAGLKVEPGAETAAAGTVLTAQELPTELSELATHPLLFGMTFEAPPEVGISISKHSPVEVTSTIIDDLQASTVLNEDGTEITKLRLRIRNNTKQYLEIELPKGALLTHSLIDGQPTRPAEGQGGRLLFPLRQSERIADGRHRTHVVSPNDTLSDIANFYYSDPSQWTAIMNANPDILNNEWDLSVGQELNIPARRGAAVQESSFVIELAYKLAHRGLRWAGWESLRLPEVGDVDTIEVTWHLYVPRAFAPLAFHSNLTQYSSIRYDPFRRLRDYLRDALWMRDVWAGGRYKSILTQRQGLFRAENSQKDKGRMVLSSFPLVGELYRFKHILIGRNTPEIGFAYVLRDFATPIRWIALGFSFAVTLLLLRRQRARKTLLYAAVGLVVLLVLAHFFLGVHRRIIWGVDLALIVTLLQLSAGRWGATVKEKLKKPWTLVHEVNFTNFAVLVLATVGLSLVLMFPLLLSSAAAVLLMWMWRRSVKKEVGHA